jgi:DNA-binding XRE family transcriptional regulator
MNLAAQKELITAYKQYNDTDKSIIKANLTRYIDKSGYKLQYIADQTGIALQTIYQIRKADTSYKPDYIISMLICDVLGISITAITATTEHNSRG